MEAIRLFPFPIRYAKDKNGEMAPTEFARKSIGVTFPLMPVISNEKIIITGSLTVTTLRGWTETEEKTFQPIFDVGGIPWVSITLESGQTVGLKAWEPQADASDSMTGSASNLKDPTYKPPKTNIPQRLFLFLTAWSGSSAITDANASRISIEKTKNLSDTTAATSPTEKMPEAVPKQDMTYPIKKNIIATIFWIGEGSSQNSGKTPFNPFYAALPFNDLAHPEAAQKWLPSNWLRPTAAGEKPRSACMDRWIKITNQAGISCYAQWKDVGPGLSDDAEYVFGNKPPKFTQGGGIDISPEAAQLLSIDDKNRIVSWQFVDDKEVPSGPWFSWQSTQGKTDLDVPKKELPLAKDILPAAPSVGNSTTPQDRYLAIYVKINDAKRLSKEGDYRGALTELKDCLEKLQAIHASNPDWESELVTNRIADCKAQIADRYLAIYVKINDAKHLSKAGDYRGALAEFKECLEKLQIIHDSNPDWESELVTNRIADCKAQIADLQPKVDERSSSTSPLKGDLLAAKEDAEAKRVLMKQTENLSDDQFLNTMQAMGRVPDPIASLPTESPISK